MRFFAVASERCSTEVEKECIALGFKNIKLQKGGVAFDGSFQDGENFCLHSFFSTRLLLELKSTTSVNSSDSLYDFARGIEWEKYLSSVEKTFLITNTVQNASWCNNAAAVSLKVKDAICDREREVFGDRSNIDKDNPDVVFHLFIDGKDTTLYVDFSSRSLSKRHYRADFTPVHLQESTASALLSFSPFLTLLEKDRLLSVIDPFCGSGTIIIEAALHASRSVPGLIDTERFAFKKLPDFNENEWNELLKKAKAEDKNGKNELKAKLTKNSNIVFKGYDIDEDAVRVARLNAEKAGISEFVSFEVKDATTLTKDDIRENAVIVTDPPYGRREENNNLAPLYFKFANNLEEIIDAGSLTLITGDEKLADIIPYENKRSFPFSNGAVKCTIVNTRFISEEERQNAIKRKEEAKQKRLSSPLYGGSLALFNELQKRLPEYQNYFLGKNVTSFRLYDGGIVPFNASIDIFADRYAVINEYLLQNKQDDDQKKDQKHEDNNTKTTDKMEELKVILERLGFDEENIFIKSRTKMLGKSQYNKINNKAEKLIIRENGLVFLVNFENYIDNGIFLDSRPIREKIERLSKGKRFLNLFSYTSTASVYAAKGGALSTYSVDSSNVYLDWSKDNMRLNGFTTMNHFYYKEDAMEFLKNLDRNTKFDLIFCDPPTFSNSHSRSSFDIQKDHEFMIKMIMNHTDKNGLLLFSTNFRKFTMSPVIENSFLVKETTNETIDIDFKDRKYPIHRSFEIRRKW